MFLNSIQKPKHQSHFIDRFDGLCDEIVASQHKWRYMENMSGAAFPSICTRKPYQVLREVSEDCQVLLHKKPYLLQEGKLYEGDREVATLGKLEEGKRSYACMGEALVLFPDKKIYNTSTGLLSDMEASVRKTGLRFSLADAFGHPYTDYVESDTEPEDRKLWLDSRNRKLKRWSNGAYETIQSLYICIEGEGVGDPFAAGDAIHIEGVTEYPDLNRSFIVENKDSNSLVLIGYLPQVFVEEGEVRIQRSVPDMQRLAVWNNRLWGIHRQKCEVYASKLGNPKVFEAFSGLSSDSYLLKLEEEPLQIIALKEELLLFCEQAIYRITGTRPQNFRCVRLSQTGLRRGSEESVQVLGNGIYYLGQEGIYHYNGLFRRINRGVLSNLGDCRAFIQGTGYYLCQVNGEEEGIFVYDSERDFWHK